MSKFSNSSKQKLKATNLVFAAVGTLDLQRKSKCMVKVKTAGVQVTAGATPG